MVEGTLFFRDGRKLTISGTPGEIIDKATELGAYRIEMQGGVLNRLFDDWVWVR